MMGSEMIYRPLFENFSEREINILLNAGCEVTVSAGDFIHTPSSPTSIAIAIVIDGIFSEQNKSGKFDIFPPGSFVCSGIFYNEEPFRIGRIKCVRDGSVILLYMDVLEKLCKKDKSLRENLNKSILTVSEREKPSNDKKMWDILISNNENVQIRIYKLRYISFFSDHLINKSEGQLFFDQFDEAKNSLSYLLIDNNKESIGTIRVMLRCSEKLSLTALDNFFYEIKKLGENSVIIESSRFCLAPEWQGSLEAKIRLFRMVLANAFFFNADYIITSVRKKHATFYKKIMKFEQISEEKEFPGVIFPHILLAVDFKKHYSTVCDNYPEFKIDYNEAIQWIIR
ncbi:MAG: GNAT family N-acetyltransferase [Magnetococcus sp. DMHC-1]